MKRKCLAALSLAAASAVSSVSMAALTTGDVVIYQIGDGTTAANATGTPLILQDINPATSTSVQAINASTQSSPLYSTNEGSLGDISLINGGTAIGFSGWTATVGSGNLSQTNTARGAGVLNLNGTYSQPATFTLATTPSSTDQVRSVTSINGTDFYFADKTGFYYSGGTNAGTVPMTPNSPVNNFRGIKSFGGTIYAVSQNNTPFIQTVSPTSSTALTLGTLAGLTATADTKVQDFTMLQSGLNGTTYDLLYVLDTGASNAAIKKYYLNSGTWTAEGTLSLVGSPLVGVAGLGAFPVSGGGGIELYVSDNPTTGNSFVSELQDTAAANATIAVAAGTVSTPTVIYTAPTGAIIDGVVAVPEPASLSLLGVGAIGLLSRRRRKA